MTGQQSEKGRDSTKAIPPFGRQRFLCRRRLLLVAASPPQPAEAKHGQSAKE
jgi:hypothetical protein